MKREKTDSITHLVKIIASEVFDEKNIEEIEAMERALLKLLSKVQDRLKKEDVAWFYAEDRLLAKEVSIAIAQIAKNHSRLNEAIIARITKNRLL